MNIFVNWYFDVWNDGVTPWNAHSNLRLAFLGNWICQKLGKVGGSIPYQHNIMLTKPFQRWNAYVTRRESIKYLWWECSMMDWRNCECTGLKVDFIEMWNCLKWQSVRFSKNRSSERPFCITGADKLTGSEQTPTDICTDKSIGTRKGTGLQCNMRTKKISRRTCAEKRSSNRWSACNEHGGMGFSRNGYSIAIQSYKDSSMTKRGAFPERRVMPYAKF